ncbi:MAG: TorF family putative porin [Caulobacteraceae bacterium]|nr:TorF family putative porin [Caulobacteraceae bacterium]
MSRALLIASTVALALGAALPAAAADESDNWRLSFGFATDYRSKGTSKTLREPYAWISQEWHTDDENYFVSVGSARVQQSFGADIETEVRAGWRPEAAGFSFDLSGLYRYYPDADKTADRDYWEVTADVSRSVGPVAARLRVQYTPDAAGTSHAFVYYEARASYRLTPKWRASAAVGRRDTEDSIDYSAWNVGVDYRVDDNVDLDLRWYDTDADDRGKQYEDALVGAINFTF